MLIFDGRGLSESTLQEWTVLALAIVATVAGGLWVWRVLRFAHRRRVGQELASGRLKLRARMERMVGRGHFPEVQETVVRAETMYGWVWIKMTRKPRIPLRVEHGWSPFRWTARRALARRANLPRR